MSANIVPVLLTGGAGSRLWPLSRESFPKQFLPLASERTLLQEAALRVADATRFRPPLVMANAEHRFMVAEQLREVGTAAARIILEPVCRDTAAAVATAALIAQKGDGDALILVMPVGRFVPGGNGLFDTIDAGLPAAKAGDLMLFGNQPAGPDACPGSGIFLALAATLLEELERYAPEVLVAARAAIDAAEEDLDFCRLDAGAFSRCPEVSFDCAVLQHTRRAKVVPADFPSSDVGSWAALWEAADRNGAGNAEIGDVVSQDTTHCYLRSEGPLIATVGVDNLVVIATPDAVLVAHRGADQDVKRLVERLRTSNHVAASKTRRVHRPWGWYETLHVGERFQVKCLTVSPGERLSLQKHHHRAEHWVVVNGTAEVHLNGVEQLVSENGSFYIPLGAQHRLANPGKIPLNVIEVQSGAFLGEDDIVRFEDVYARA